MRKFDSPGAFAQYLMAVAARLPAAQHEGLERAAQCVETEAKSLIGAYQQAAGPFEAWRELSDATRAERVRLGYPADEPLLRTGDLRDSISHVVRGNEASIGSNNPIAVYQEIGTSRIPQRSFLGISLIHRSRDVVRLLHEATAYALVGRRPPGR